VPIFKLEDCTRRREFITLLGGGVAAWTRTARAQQGERVRRIGVLGYGADTPAGRSGFSFFRVALEQLGWIESGSLKPGGINRAPVFH
jgi:putative ABC transport system substrate-binding protein